MFISSSEVHTINTRHSSNLHPQSRNLTELQKGICYSVIKIFSHLPQNSKNLFCDVKKFKLALKKFLLAGLFYSIEEYFDWVAAI